MHHTQNLQMFEDNSMMQIYDMMNNASCKAAVDYRDWEVPK